LDKKLQISEKQHGRVMIRFVRKFSKQHFLVMVAGSLLEIN
jgi:hypothetical protein